MMDVELPDTADFFHLSDCMVLEYYYLGSSGNTRPLHRLNPAIKTVNLIIPFAGHAHPVVRR